MSVPLLATQSLSFMIGERYLVKDITFAIQPGECIALVGPNGAGKSTLLSLLSGDRKPSAGDILLSGQTLDQINTLDQAKKRAVLRQHIQVAFPFTAIEVVLMGRHPHLQGRREGPADLAIAQKALERTETLHLAERHFPTLSGGEQARVSLARVLAQEAPLLLLDEPTAALDLRHQHSALQLAQAVSQQGGASLAVLHDVNLAALYADRIGIMHRGSLVALGTPWDVLRADLLSEVYGVPIRVQPHPYLDAPLVLVLPANSGGDRHAYHAAHGSAVMPSA